MKQFVFESGPHDTFRLFSRMRMCKTRGQRRGRRRQRRMSMATMSMEPHDSRLLRTDLPPTDSEAKVLAQLTAAAATWSFFAPPPQSRPPAMSNLRHVQ